LVQSGDFALDNSPLDIINAETGKVTGRLLTLDRVRLASLVTTPYAALTKFVCLRPYRHLQFVSPKGDIYAPLSPPEVSG
jgi:hypothetical protein